MDQEYSHVKVKLHRGFSCCFAAETEPVPTTSCEPDTDVTAPVQTRGENLTSHAISPAWPMSSHVCFNVSCCVHTCATKFLWFLEYVAAFVISKLVWHAQIQKNKQTYGILLYQYHHFLSYFRTEYLHISRWNWDNLYWIHRVESSLTVETTNSEIILWKTYLMCETSLFIQKSNRAVLIVPEPILAIDISS